MTNPKAIAVQPPPDSPAVPLTSAGLEQVIRFPSLLVPPSVRPALYVCWLAHKTLKGLEDPMALAAPIAVWMAEDGLTADDASAALKAMQRPAAFKTHEWGSQLVADLAAKVEAVLGKRKQEAEQAQREAERKESRAAWEEAQTGSTPAEREARRRQNQELADRLADMGLNSLSRKYAPAA